MCSKINLKIDILKIINLYFFNCLQKDFYHLNYIKIILLISLMEMKISIYIMKIKTMLFNDKTNNVKNYIFENK